MDFSPEDLTGVRQVDKREKAAAAEKASLKEKLERLQRANKQRRGELDEMQAKLSSMHQRASAYDQACLDFLIKAAFLFVPAGAFGARV